MADQHTHDLEYGHLGQILYNPNDGTWLNRRALGTPYALKPLNRSQWAVKPAGLPTSQQDSASDAQDAPNYTSKHFSHQETKLSRQIDISVTQLIRRVPTLTPAAALSASLSHLSRDVTTVTSRHDPTIGDLLAFGTVQDYATKRSFSVAAFPSRSSSASLCLTQVQYQKQGWDRNKSIWIQVPRIAGESVVWNSTQPIIQLCFVTPYEEKDRFTPYLAVRTSVAVHILRLSMRSQRSSIDSTPHAATRFNIVPLYTLGLDMLEDLPPAHVSFNPSYKKQVAVIDQAGTWRIWDTSRHIPNHPGRPLEVASGAVGAMSVSMAYAERMLDDGWGRVTWAADSSTIIAATRRAIGVYDVADKPLRLLSPDLGIDNTPHWILDIHTSPAGHDFVFVLTSVHLICLRIQSVASLSSADYETAGAHIVFRTSHFRDAEDISLRLSAFVDEEDTVILIRSSLSLVATSYRCSLVPTSTTPFLTVSDPALLDLPESPSDSGTLSPLLGLRVHPARYGEGSIGASGLGISYRDSAVRFYMITMLSSDMSIVEELYFGRPEPDAASNRDYAEIQPVNWHHRITDGATRAQTKHFVIDDHHAIEDAEPNADKNDSSSIHGSKPTRALSTAVYRKGWTISHAKSYDKISRSERAGAQDFSDVLEVIRSRLESQDESQGQSMNTLFDICQSHISVGDLDEATDHFRRLVLEYTDRDSLLDGPARWEPAILAEPNVLGLPMEMSRRPDPIAIYNSIISHWLAPLSQSVPGRVRLAKEQLARRVAAEICLACFGLKPSLDMNLPQDEQLDTTEIPVSQSYSFSGSSQLQGTFPTPSPTATPSLTTATSLSSHPSTLASSEHMRLQKYTRFDAETTTPAPLPRLLSRKLAHWSVGGDPDVYDWLETQRQQDKEAEEEDEGLSQKERARIKKRAERHLRKQRREMQKAATIGFASSQAPEIFSASQPTAVLQQRGPASSVVHAAASQAIPLYSSQAILSQPPPVAASQIEPGRFGGRAPVASQPKKKRKRNEGF